MKICVFKESLGIGGTERSAANISKVLNKNHDVYMAVYDGSDVTYEYGGKLVDFKLPAKAGKAAKVINNLRRIVRYERLVRTEKIDLLYEFISINNPISRLHHRDRIRIISARDFSVLDRCKERFHTCLQNADAMVCNSRYLKRYYLKFYPQDKGKVFTIYNIIDGKLIRRQRGEATEEAFQAFLHAHEKTLVSVGRFCKEKGFEYLLEAFAKARAKDSGLGLVLVGEGQEYRQIYEAILERHALGEHVYFTGFQKNPYKYMGQCSCFVLSSVSEGFPNVLAEGMMLGLPVIAVNCFTGPAEILRKDADYGAVTDRFAECDYGILTPAWKEHDNAAAIDELAAAILHLVSDPLLMHRYGRLAEKRAKSLSPEAVGERLNKLLSVLSERKQKR